MSEPFCHCGQRLDTYEELKALTPLPGTEDMVEMAHYIADTYLGPGGFYCAEEDDVVPPEYVIWRETVRG